MSKDERTDGVYLLHIVSAMNDVQEFLKGKDYQEFAQSRLLINAVVRSCEIMGEATKNLTDSFRAAHPEIEWKGMAGFRDILIHQYWRERSVVSKHIRNVFREGELDEKVSCAKFAHDTPHGAIKGKMKTSYTTLYNLDVIISVGYRVKSIQGTRFRQWATRILREMLLSRCDEIRRLDKLEHRVGDMEREMSQVKSGMNYLVKQITTPPKPPKRRPIGFNT